MQKVIDLLDITFQPLFYYFLCFSLGICVQNYLKYNLFILLAIIFILAVLRLITQIRLITLLICMVLGAAAFCFAENHNTNIENKIALLKDINEPIEVYGEIIAPITTSKGQSYLSLRTDYFRTRTKVLALNYAARVLIWHDDTEAERAYQHLNLRPGAVVRLEVMVQPRQKYCNPGQNDSNWLIEQGFDIALTVKSPHLVEILANNPAPFNNILETIRCYIFSRIDSNFNNQTGALIKATVMGNGHFLDKETGEAFRQSGLYHILIISGSHIALLTLVLNFLLSPLVTNRYGRFILVVSIIWLYSLIIGNEVPVLRAVVMCTAGLVSQLLYRKVSPINFFGLAGLLLLIYQPYSLFDPGFQLSFLAAAAILLIVMPVIAKIRDIGSWKPSYLSPYPPQSSSLIKFMAEILFWRQKQFERELNDLPYHYRLDKTIWAIWLEKLGLQRILSIITIFLFTSTIVQLSLLPLSISYFHRFAWIGVVGGLIAELLLIVLLVAFMGFLLIDLFFPILAKFSILLVDLIVTAFDNVAKLLGQGEIAHSLFSFRIEGYQDYALIYAIYYVWLLFLVIAISHWRPLPKDLFTKIKRSYRVPVIWLLIYLLLLSALLFPQYFRGSHFHKGEFEITYLDVGQGDAAFLVFPGGTTMMIDSGGGIFQRRRDNFNPDINTIGEEVDAKFLWWRGILQIDYLLATHSHADHIEGFNDLIKIFPIKQAIFPAIPKQDKDFQRLCVQLEQNSIPWKIWSQGESFDIEGVKVEVLWPPNNAHPLMLDNNQSLVLRFTYGEQSFLFTGDIEKEAEEVLLAQKEILSSTVLKVPHHGSNSSSTEPFLQKVSAKLAIISAPLRSPFHHPHATVVHRYQQLNTKILQTGIKGAITITTDGHQINWQAYRTKESGQIEQ